MVVVEDQPTSLTSFVSKIFGYLLVSVECYLVNFGLLTAQEISLEGKGVTIVNYNGVGYITMCRQYFHSIELLWLFELDHFYAVDFVYNFFDSTHLVTLS